MTQLAQGVQDPVRGSVYGPVPLHATPRKGDSFASTFANLWQLTYVFSLLGTSTVVISRVVSSVRHWHS